jgi:membrane protease YdiL (CAAX protease family)
LLVSNAVSQVALIGLAVILGYGTNIRWWQSAFSLASIGLGILVGLLAVLVIFCVTKSSLSVFEQLQTDLRKIIDLFAPVRRALDLFLLSVMAGIGEEAIFRGFLQPWLASMLPIAMGILCSAALFGLIHFISLSYSLYITVLGVLFGVITFHSDGPWSAMAAHAVFDFVAFWLGMNYFFSGQDSMPHDPPLPKM